MQAALLTTTETVLKSTVSVTARTVPLRLSQSPLCFMHGIATTDHSVHGAAKDAALAPNPGFCPR
jgi:hypothetical protein